MTDASELIPDGLPGGELVREGLADLRDGRANTQAALLVAEAAPRLRRRGIHVPDSRFDGMACPHK